MRTFLFNWIRAGVFAVVAGALGACSTPAPSFVAPADRAVSPTQQPWPENRVLILAYHDVQDSKPDQRFIAVHTHHLAQHFAWLRENNYQPVSVEQILRARNHGPALPARAVLLTFDDGYTSFKERVLPLLQAYGWPAVLAPVGVWADTPADRPINFGGQSVKREHFLNWQAIRDIHASGLVEIASHSNNLHFGAPANPQGNTQPAAATRLYDASSGRYESDQAYAARIRGDADAITRKIEKTTGQRPRVWVWPYGEANGEAIAILQSAGYELIMTLDWGLADLGKPASMPRLLVSDDPDLPAFSNTVLAMEENNLMRAAEIRLDDIHDASPERTADKLGTLVQRIADMKINTVLLHPFALPDNTGKDLAAYFPNRHLGMRADLFNRAAWQLRTRAGVSVYAVIPLKALRQGANLDEKQWLDLAQDLARYSNFAGVVIDTEDNTDNNSQLQEQFVQVVQEIRGPQVRSVSMIDSTTHQSQESLEQLAQHVKRSMGKHDWAMVRLSQPAAANATERPAQIATALTETLNRKNGDLKRVVLLVSLPEQGPGDTPAQAQQSSRTLANTLIQLQQQGLPSLAYGFDDPELDYPRLTQVRPALSTAWYPYK